jgi:hypothetical protein
MVMHLLSVYQVGWWDDDIKVLYFPMALETVPLAWFDKLRPNSIILGNNLIASSMKIFMVCSPIQVLR